MSAANRRAEVASTAIGAEAATRRVERTFLIRATTVGGAEHAAAGGRIGSVAVVSASRTFATVAVAFAAAVVAVTDVLLVVTIVGVQSSLCFIALLCYEAYRVERAVDMRQVEMS